MLNTITAAAMHIIMHVEGINNHGSVLAIPHLAYYISDSNNLFTDAINMFDGVKADGTTDPHCFNKNNTLNSKLPLCTGGIFATYPAPHLSLANGFLDQVILWCTHP